MKLASEADSLAGPGLPPISMKHCRAEAPQCFGHRRSPMRMSFAEMGRERDPTATEARSSRPEIERPTQRANARRQLRVNPSPFNEIKDLAQPQRGQRGRGMAAAKTEASESIRTLGGLANTRSPFNGHKETHTWKCNQRSR